MFRPITYLRGKVTPTLTSESKRLPDFTVPLRDKQTLVGSTARLTCRVASRSRLTTKWYKDGRIITSGGRYHVQSDLASQTLIIRDCQLDDSGNYRCEAKNNDGISTTDAYLTVQGTIP